MKNNSVKRKIENETRNNFDYNNKYRKSNYGEIMDNKTIQEEKMINLRFMRGISVSESHDVMENIIENIKVDIGTAAYEEILKGEASKFSLTPVTTEDEVQLPAPIGLGPRPDAANYTSQNQYVAASKVYEANESSTRIKWLKDKSAYERDVVKVKGVVLRDHVSPELLKATKKNQSKEYTATESTKTLVNFFALLRKAIGLEVDDNTTDLVTTIKKEISNLKISQFGDATEYISKQQDLVRNWIEAEIALRVERLPDSLSDGQRKDRKDITEEDVEYEVEGDSTVGDKIYREVLNCGVPTEKRDQYTKRDGDLELKAGTSQYSRRKDESGKTVGGLSVVFTAVKKTLANLKMKYPVQKLYFHSNRFIKDLNVSATLTKDDKASKDPRKEVKEKDQCFFCRDKLKSPQSAKTHTYYDCHWSPKCRKFMGEDAKKARLLKAEKLSKTPKPPHLDGGRHPSTE